MPIMRSTQPMVPASPPSVTTVVVMWQLSRQALTGIFTGKALRGSSNDNDFKTHDRPRPSLGVEPMEVVLIPSGRGGQCGDSEVIPAAGEYADVKVEEEVWFRVQDQCEHRRGLVNDPCLVDEVVALMQAGSAWWRTGGYRDTEEQ